jgi:hypothetical protein
MITQKMKRYSMKTSSPPLYTFTSYHSGCSSAKALWIPSMKMIVRRCDDEKNTP